MPRIDNYDLYGDSYHSSEFSTFFLIGLAGLIIFFWIVGLCDAKNKTDYVKDTIFGTIATIFASIAITIGGVFWWFFSFLKTILGIDNSADKDGAGCFIIFYRLIFILGAICFIAALID